MKKAAPFNLSSRLVSRVLKIVDAGLSHGMGEPKPGSMCVEAAVCYALGLPHGDEPNCVAPSIRSLKIALNDSPWSSRKIRAVGLRKLAVLQLGTRDHFNEEEFIERVILMAVKTILSPLLEETGLDKFAKACSNVKTLDDACHEVLEPCFSKVVHKPLQSQYGVYEVTRSIRSAVRAANEARRCLAASKIVYVSRDAFHEVAANESGHAVRRATHYSREAGDELLKSFADRVADILIDMKVPAVKYLYLLKD